ncbi:MAG TPA: hypothetical protein VJT49_15880 [Amycolatopsis sp.]|uniref:hypothetical protein n=1 Tax=Amycolatopsis sp. TaxID=37632 RepID=UPI002B47810F|nr:hypothetical protein [Amycolatopsis sp.]HKS46558.1 hypothetical protein [Amycolatopsis sp.]
MQTEQNAVSAIAPRLDYRGLFGWPVSWHNGGLMLVTGSGVGAVTVPRALSDQVLESLARQGCAGPALSLPTKQGVVVILLVETDTLASGEESLPTGVRVLNAGASIPLPEHRRADELAHWIVPPDTSQRWLPSLTAVLTCIRSSCRVRLETSAHR